MGSDNKSDHPENFGNLEKITTRNETKIKVTKLHAHTFYSQTFPVQAVTNETASLLMTIPVIIIACTETFILLMVLTYGI